jgi:short-subunit dehydrogenase
MKNNILIVGGTSEIALVVAKKLHESGRNLYSISRKKNNNEFYKSSLKINFDKNTFKKLLLNNFFSKIKFSAILFFNAAQVNNNNSFFNLSNEYLFKIVNVNCFFSVKLIYFLIHKKNLIKNVKLSFFQADQEALKREESLSIMLRKAIICIAQVNHY